MEAILLNLLFRYFGRGVSWTAVGLQVLLLGVYQSSFWNTIHPDIHGVTLQLSWWEGIPGWDGWKTLLAVIPVSQKGGYEWMKENHTLHHLRKGVRKGNFNVTLPGADFLCGTYFNSTN